MEKLKFIDLFAGIGGIRMAFEDKTTNCVFSSEWDKFSQKLMQRTLTNYLSRYH